MTTVRKSITFTEQQDAWIKLQIESGHYTNDSEYIRDLIRKDQLVKNKFLHLKTEIDKGWDGPDSTRTIKDIIKDKRKRKAN